MLVVRQHSLEPVQVVAVTGVVMPLDKARSNGAPQQAATPVAVVAQVGPPATSVLLRTIKVQSRGTEN